MEQTQKHHECVSGTGLSPVTVSRKRAVTFASVLLTDDVYGSQFWRRVNLVASVHGTFADWVYAEGRGRVFAMQICLLSELIAIAMKIISATCSFIVWGEDEDS